MLTNKWQKLIEWEKITDVPTIALYIEKEKFIYSGERTVEHIHPWMVDKLREKLGDKLIVREDPLEFGLPYTVALLVGVAVFSAYIMHVIKSRKASAAKPERNGAAPKSEPKGETKKVK